MNIRSKIPVMSYRQYRQARKLVHECCNYDNGNCIALDDEKIIGVPTKSYDFVGREPCAAKVHRKQKNASDRKRRLLCGQLEAKTP